MTWTQTIITIKDAAGANQPIIAYTDGTNLAFARPVLDNTGAIISPATSARQDTGNTSVGNLDTNLGAKADAAATTDTGTFSLIALFKRGLQALASIAAYLAPVTGVIPLTLDTTATAGRSFAAKVTSAGNVNVTLSDGTTSTYPVSVGLNVFPFGVTKVNTAGTTATGTYENWK